MIFPCAICGSENVRPSHFRWRDLPRLLILRSPARCRECRARFYVSSFRIRTLRRIAAARYAREEHDAQVSQIMLEREKKHLR